MHFIRALSVAPRIFIINYFVSLSSSALVYVMKTKQNNIGGNVRARYTFHVFQMILSAPISACSQHLFLALYIFLLRDFADRNGRSTTTRCKLVFYIILAYCIISQYVIIYEWLFFGWLSYSGYTNTIGTLVRGRWQHRVMINCNLATKQFEMFLLHLRISHSYPGYSFAENSTQNKNNQNICFRTVPNGREMSHLFDVVTAAAIARSKGLTNSSVDTVPTPNL